jgi:hypothetical protein
VSLGLDFFFLWFGVFLVPVDLNFWSYIHSSSNIRVLCPWEWILASRGLGFEFLVMHAFSNVFLMSPMHEAIKWHKFNKPLLCCMHFVCGEAFQIMCIPCMVYQKVLNEKWLNEMWQDMRCIFCSCGFELPGHVCILVPYIKVLCPWKWISSYLGLMFLLSLWIWTSSLIMHSSSIH